MIDADIDGLEDGVDDDEDDEDADGVVPPVVDLENAGARGAGMATDTALSANALAKRPPECLLSAVSTERRLEVEGEDKEDEGPRDEVKATLTRDKVAIFFTTSLNFGVCFSTSLRLRTALGLDFGKALAYMLVLIFASSPCRSFVWHSRLNWGSLKPAHAQIQMS